VKKRSVLNLTGRAFALVALAMAVAVKAQNNDGANKASAPSTNSAPLAQQTLAQQARAYEQASEKIRADCIQGRRTICGRILKILPNGLVVDSGYTNLMRSPLNKSWLVPGTVQTDRPANLVEGNEPGCVCVGLVFLTALPKSRPLLRPKPYDYINLQGYPAGNETYTSVGTIRRTVRRFAATLPTAIRINRDLAGIKPPTFPPPVTPAPAAK
jgi:hypothetical protein